VIISIITLAIIMSVYLILSSTGLSKRFVIRALFSVAIIVALYLFLFPLLSFSFVEDNLLLSSLIALWAFTLSMVIIRLPDRNPDLRVPAG